MVQRWEDVDWRRNRVEVDFMETQNRLALT